MRNGGAEQLVRMLPQVSDKQEANLVATGSTMQRAAYVQRVVDPKLSLPACRREEYGAVWMLKHFIVVSWNGGEMIAFRGGVYGGLDHTATPPTDTS